MQANKIKWDKTQECQYQLAKAEFTIRIAGSEVSKSIAGSF